MSAQYDRRTARALVCGALLVYGCLRIPAAAQSLDPETARLQDHPEAVRQLEAGLPQRFDLAVVGEREPGSGG